MRLPSYTHPFTGRPLARSAKGGPPMLRGIDDEDITHAWLLLGSHVGAAAYKRRVLIVAPNGRLRVLTEQQAETAPPRIRVVGTYTSRVTLEQLTEDVRHTEAEIRAERRAWDEAHRQEVAA